MSNTEKNDETVEPTETAPDASGVDAAQVLANAGDVNVRNASDGGNGVVTNDFLAEDDAPGAAGWRVGAPAPATKYLDKDGTTVLDEMRFTDGTGSVLVKEGEKVTESILQKLGDNK